MNRPIWGDLSIRGYGSADVRAWTFADVVTFMANEMAARGYRGDIVAKCAEARAAVLEAFETIDEGKRQWDQVAASLGVDGDDADAVLARAADVAELVELATRARGMVDSEGMFVDGLDALLSKFGVSL